MFPVIFITKETTFLSLSFTIHVLINLGNIEYELIAISSSFLEYKDK